jgi:hypothetical protein
MIFSPVYSAGRAYERFASLVECCCGIRGFVTLGRSGIVEHAERTIADLIHHHRVDGVGHRGELPER